MNTFLFISEIVICYSSLILLYHLYELKGLSLWMIFGTIFTNLMMLKTINVSGFDINLGIAIEATIFIAQNIIIQQKGPTNTNKQLLIIALTSFFSYFVLNFVSLINNSQLTLDMNNSYNLIFNSNIKLYLATNISLLVSFWLNSKIYYTARKIENKIWISNTLSIIITEFVNVIIFLAIYLLTNTDFKIILAIMMIRYLLLLLTGSIGTFIIYYINALERK